jgi:hypothetical protein
MKVYRFHASGASNLFFAVPSGFIALMGNGEPFFDLRRFIMNKDFWKTVFCWLETASLEEIRDKQSAVRQMHDQIDDRDLQADIRRILRFMDQELLARAELAKLIKIKVISL